MSETKTGRISAVSQHGFKIAGADQWFNWSRDLQDAPPKVEKGDKVAFDFQTNVAANGKTYWNVSDLAVTPTGSSEPTQPGAGPEGQDSIIDPYSRNGERGTWVYKERSLELQGVMGHAIEVLKLDTHDVNGQPMTCLELTDRLKTIAEDLLAWRDERLMPPEEEPA